MQPYSLLHYVKPEKYGLNSQPYQNMVSAIYEPRLKYLSPFCHTNNTNSNPNIYNH